MDLAELLLDLLYTNESGEACVYCDNTRAHTYYVRVQRTPTLPWYVGLECIPDALGYKPSPGFYAKVASRSMFGAFHQVWIGDATNPPHCPCEAFRYADRSKGDKVECWHLAQVRGAISRGVPADVLTQRHVVIAEGGGSRKDKLLRGFQNGVVQESEE